MEKDLIFSLALFPAIDGALLRHPLNRTPKAAQQELYKEPAVHINVHYHLPSMQRNFKVQSLSWPELCLKMVDAMFVALSAAVFLNALWRTQDV